MEDRIKLALDTYKSWYERDTAFYGDGYWKNKLLSLHGYLDKIGVLWSEEYEDEDVLHILDEVSILWLAEIIVKDY